LNIVYNGEVVTNRDSFLKRLVKSGEKFVLLSGTLQAKRWKRFKELRTGDYFYMYNSWPDAIAFVPKRDIFFMGFAFNNHYNKKDFKLIFKYNIDG
jgi:hypothetical protein